MVKKKTLIIVNISLGFLAFLLLLSLFDVTIPSLGKAAFVVDQSDPVCLVSWNGEFNDRGNLDRCCLEAREQSSCRRTQTPEGQSDIKWVCGEGGTNVQYWLNAKAYNYCKQQVIW